MNRRLLMPPAIAILLLGATGCGEEQSEVELGRPAPTEDRSTGPTDGEASPGDEGTGTPDAASDAPVDPGYEPPEDWADFPVEPAREEARAVLGMNEEDLPEDVRIGRRGEETMMLTEDYVLGRRTVELDRTEPDGPYRVVSVVVELPEGPETYELEPS